MPAAKVEVLAGAPASGKTQALVERVAGLLDGGAAPGDVLVVTATSDGALELAARLRSCLSCPAPRVVAWRRLAWELTGRPRVLSQPERSILLADLRAQGFSPSQVSDALDLAGTAPACRDDAEGDVQPAEAACLKALLAALDARGATLPEALVSQAQSGMRAAPMAVSHIFVDDADAIPLRALRFLAGLAQAGVLMAGNLSGATAADSAAFLSLAGEDSTRLLPKPQHAVHAASSQAVKWVDAAEEAAGVAALADRALAGSQAGAGPVVVAVPNRPWARRMAQAFSRAGVAACDAMAPALACDPRDPSGCAPLRCFAALGLLADPRDLASWRAWCSLGYSDLSCAAWRNLQDYAARCGLHAADALRRASEQVEAGATPFAGAQHLAARVREADALAAAAREAKRGFLLLDAVDPARTPAFRRLFALPGDDLAAMDAAALFRVAQQAAFDPALGVLPFEARGAQVYAGDAPALDRRAYICTPGSLAGVHPHLLVAAGANAGLFDTAPLAGMLSLQAGSLVVSYIQRMPVEAARRLGASFRRTRREAGEEVALLQPSPALEALGGEAPAVMSGQQYCSAVLGVRP